MLDRGPGVDSTIRLYHRYRKDAERARAEALDELRQAQKEAAAAKKAEEREKAKSATGWQAIVNRIMGPEAKTRDVPRRAPSALRRWWHRRPPRSRRSSSSRQP